MFENIACLNYLAIEPTFDSRGRCNGFLVHSGHTPSAYIIDAGEICGKHVPQEAMTGIPAAHMRGLRKILDTGHAKRRVYRLPSGVKIDMLIIKVSTSCLGLLYSEHTASGTTQQQTCRLIRSQSPTFSHALLASLRHRLHQRP